jgi:hypothetical protein
VCKTPGTPVPKPPYYCWPVCPGPVTRGRAQDTRHLQAEQRIAPHWDCSTQVCCCCRCHTWPVGSPPLQQISHGKLHTGHSRTGRHCRATPLDAAAATQDHQVLSQNQRAGEHEQRRHPQRSQGQPSSARGLYRSRLCQTGSAPASTVYGPQVAGQGCPCA